jgi:hypothetical protein
MSHIMGLSQASPVKSAHASNAVHGYSGNMIIDVVKILESGRLLNRG